MNKDIVIAENIQRLISSRDSANDSYISLSSAVIEGVLHIAFTAMDNDTFRESYTWATFMSDLLGRDDRKETWGNAHFAMDFEAIKPFMMDQIAKNKGLPIILSGHGVAGSIAVMAGYYLLMQGENLQRVVTFGAPRALNFNKKNDYFFEAIQEITKQYVLKNDVLPKMFRLTKYCSVNRTALDMLGENCGINDYVDAMGVGDGGLL